MQNKKLQIAAVVVFCAFIGAFGLMYAVLPKADFSEKEKRVLSDFPDTSIESIFDGSFETGFETWMSDHVPLRDVLVGMNAAYELASGRNGLNGVIFHDGKLMATAEEMDAENIAGKCGKINRFAEETGLAADVMLVPAAGYIFSDELPMHAQYQDAALAETVRECLSEDVGFVWPEEMLREKRGEGVYYRTDHHLTSRGTYEIARMYAESIGMDIPEAAEYEIETHDGFYGSMYAKAGLWNVEPDSIEIWRSSKTQGAQVTFDDREDAEDMFFTEHLSEMDKYPVFMDGNHGLAVIETGREGGENLLMVRDSFGHCFAPFAADMFDGVVLVDLRYYRKSVSELAAEMEIDRVLFLYGTDTFITDTNFGWLR